MNPTLATLIDTEWQNRLEEDPFFATTTGDNRFNDRVPELSLAAAQRRAEFARAILHRLEQVHEEGLDEAETLNRAMLMRELRERLEAFEFGAYLMPLSNLAGPHTVLPDLLLMTPFRDAGDYSAYLRRLRGLRQYFAGHIDLLREGQRRGIVQAQVAINGLADSLGALIVDDPTDSLLYEPFRRFPEGVALEERAELAAAAQTALRESVLPGLRDLRDYLLSEGLPSARVQEGIATLPGGADYYAALVRKFTTLDLTPQQVFETGQAEVARIRAEMDAVMRSTGFTGAFPEFLRMLRGDPRFYAATPDDLMKTVALLMKRMEGELPRLFAVLPRTPFGMREIPAHIAPFNTSAYYFPASGDGKTAGFYYVNTYDLPARPLYEYEALSFHEAVPGHHLQLALQQELTGVPDFRRYSSVDAFIEGWALYAERLGLEVGFYRDPYSNFGRLTFEMWRACRLVVDPGLHVLGWTRQQAIDFMVEHTALSRRNIENEVDRYISWPGQALAYKIGELHIRALRQQAEDALGERFDLRQFHRVLLQDGAVPLDVVSEKVSVWVAGQAGG